MTTKKTIELVKEGFANGVAIGGPLSDEDKAWMIEEAAEKFGEFLDALNAIGEMIQIQIILLKE